MTNTSGTTPNKPNLAAVQELLRRVHEWRMDQPQAKKPRKRGYGIVKV
jgi:hypothetical protein